MDLTPEGRPEFEEQMQYGCCEEGKAGKVKGWGELRASPRSLLSTPVLLGMQRNASQKAVLEDFHLLCEL
jgi:hypothetical protein